MVLPECASHEARVRLEQICKKMKEKRLVFRGQELPGITVSVGVAELGGDLISADTLITAADAALYAAKHNGRDRIEIFSREFTQSAPIAAGLPPLNEAKSKPGVADQKEGHHAD